MTATSVPPPEVVSRWDTWQIIATPFLDTKFPADFRAAFRDELKSRGVTGRAFVWRWLIAAGGLWWNVLWWEWGALGRRDIIFGWISNFLLAIALVVAYFTHWAIGVIFFFAISWLVRIGLRRVWLRESHGP